MHGGMVQMRNFTTVFMLVVSRGEIKLLRVQDALLKHPNFLALLNACDPCKNHVPSRGKCKYKANDKIQDTLSLTNKISLSTYIWTKQGMSSF